MDLTFSIVFIMFLNVRKNNNTHDNQFKQNGSIKVSAMFIVGNHWCVY